MGLTMQQWSGQHEHAVHLHVALANLDARHVQTMQQQVQLVVQQQLQEQQAQIHSALRKQQHQGVTPAHCSAGVDIADCGVADALGGGYIPRPVAVAGADVGVQRDGRLDRPP